MDLKTIQKASFVTGYFFMYVQAVISLYKVLNSQGIKESKQEPTQEEEKEESKIPSPAKESDHTSETSSAPISLTPDQ